MKKELEVLLRELKLLKNDIKSCEIKEVSALIPHLGIGNPNPQQHLLVHVENIEKYLTPPTANEVCEALSKHLGYEVEAWNEYGEMCFKSVYTSPFQRISKNYETIIWLHGNNVTFREELRLPPHLITLIGRFYEGLEENNEK